MKKKSVRVMLLLPTSRTVRWYAQVFSGFGETLLDYNHRQTSIGLGLALFQF